MPARMTVHDQDVRRALQVLPQSLRRNALIPAMRAYLKVARAEARKADLGFRDRSGRLRSSIRALAPKGGSRKRPYLSGALSSSVPYAGIVEFGRSGASSDTSFLREAFDRTEAEGFRIFDREVARWLRDLD